MSRNTALFIALFFIILAYFVSSHCWYPHAKLTIQGNAELNSTITARWDSGEGFNNYEERRFSFLPFYGSAETNVTIDIEGGARKHKSSRGTRVILNELRIDDRGVSIPKEALQDVRHAPGQGWYFTKSGSKISLDLPAKQQLQFSFKTSSNSGIADITINESKTSQNLYRRNWEVLFSEINFWLLDEDGNFTLSFYLPRYYIDKLEITGTGITEFSTVNITSGTSSVDLWFEETAPGTIRVIEPNSSLKRLFNPTHFFFQAVFALLLALGLWSVLIKYSSFESIGNLFIAERRWLFWLFLGGGLIVYGAWLLAFWPGIMSVDSLNIWRAAQLPEEMINNHPFINELWYFFLSLLWQNTAVVPIVQIVLLSCLVAAIFFSTVTRGVSCWLVVPCYLLLLFSVPVGLYTATLWKDVPFALLVILWALAPVYFYERKRAGNKVQLSFFGGGLLLLSFLCLLLFRHNGLVYLFVIPLLFLILGLIRVPKLVVFAGCIAGGLLLYLVVFPPSNMKSASYFHDLSRKYVHQIGAESIPQRFADASQNYPRLLDIKRNQDTSDFWHYYLGDRYAYEFLTEVGWSDVYPYLPRDASPFPKLKELALEIYDVTLDYPWLYLSWYPFVFLYLFPLSILFCRWFPLSAIFSTVILAQVAGLLLFVGTVNWRYYYFVLLGGYFLLPMLLIGAAAVYHNVLEINITSLFNH